MLALKQHFREIVGLVDIGSNTIRLVIYGIDAWYQFNEIHNIKNPARLSQYVYQEKDGSRWMAQEGIDILIATLESFRLIADQFHVNNLYPMATAAIRQSQNQADILLQVKEATGLDLEVLSEEEEAGYGAYAITHSITARDGITVDIGGGSCEITLFENKEVKALHSFPFGAVSLKTAFLEGKAHNDPKALEKLSKYVRKAFKAVDWIKKAKQPIIAIGGSARAVANVYQRSIHYPMAGLHGYAMNQDQIEKTLEIFMQTPLADMENIDGLSGDRADIIIPAATVFRELVQVVKADRFIISTQGLREGIIMDYINKSYNTPLDKDLVKYLSISKIIRDLPINTLASQLSVDYTIQLYGQICRMGLLAYDYDWQELLEYAAMLYRFGKFISVEADSQHTFYLLSNMNIPGFSHRRRLVLALLASYRNRSLFRQYLDDYTGWLDPEEAQTIQKLAGIIKFATALNDSKTGPINRINLTQEPGDSCQYRLEIYYSGTILAEHYRAHRHKKHLERALQGDLTLHFIEEPLRKETEDADL